MIGLSIVIPVHGEEATLPALHHRLVTTLRNLSPPLPYEIIYVDDGSRDGSQRQLVALAQTDAQVRIIALARRFGHQAAITAGLDHACGAAAIVMDADLQDPPELIPAFIERWHGGAQVVYGVRRRRVGDSWPKRWCATSYYLLLHYLADIRIPLDSGDFRLIDRQVVQELRRLRETHRYVRGLVAWIGFRQEPLYYDRPRRHAGVTKFTLPGMLRLAWDGITSFSGKPLRLIGTSGRMLAAVALGMALNEYFSRRPSNAVGMVCILVSVSTALVLMALGVVAQYVGRLHRQSQGRPVYIVAQRFGFTPSRKRRAVIGLRRKRLRQNID